MFTDFNAFSNEQLSDLIFQANRELKVRKAKEYIVSVKNVLNAISPLVKSHPDWIAVDGGTEGDIDWKTLYDWIQEELKFFMEN